MVYRSQTLKSEVRCEINTHDRNRGGTHIGGQEVTDVRVTGKEESPRLCSSPLATNHSFANARNRGRVA